MVGDRAWTLILAALFWSAQVAAAPSCRVESGPLARPLVELYTSEGCDSCPPAERWLSSRFLPDAREPAIPLAFHVDYWDRLGWVDRFASARYTARQYAAMRANGASFVYTPQVLLQGRDYAGWRSDDVEAIDAAAKTAARAKIAVEVTPGAREVAVHARANVATERRGDAELFVAYVDSGLVSQVGAGENRGLRLVHDHVVRALRRVGRADAAGRIDATLSLQRPAERGSDPTVVAFVERPSSGEVLQALALPLDGCPPH